MKVLGLLVAAFLALAVLQAAAAVFVAVIILLLVWGAYAKPTETFGLLMSLVVANLIAQHGLAFLLTLGVLGLTALLTNRRKPPREVEDVVFLAPTVDQEETHSRE